MKYQIVAGVCLRLIYLHFPCHSTLHSVYVTVCAVPKSSQILATIFHGKICIVSLEKCGVSTVAAEQAIYKRLGYLVNVTPVGIKAGCKQLYIIDPQKITSLQFFHQSFTPLSTSRFMGQIQVTSWYEGFNILQSFFVGAFLHVDQLLVVLGDAGSLSG